MTEYYLVYRTEKGNPESATHAVRVEGINQKLAGAIENEIQNRYGSETFDVVFFKTQKMSISKAVKLKRLVDAYECDHNGDYDSRWKSNRNRVLYDIEYWIADLKTLQANPNVVWEDSHTSPDVEELFHYNILVYDDGEHKTLGAINSIGDLTIEEIEAFKPIFERTYTGMYHPVFMRDDELPTDLQSKITFAALRKKHEDGRISDGRLRPIREALNLADTIRNHRNTETNNQVDSAKCTIAKKEPAITVKPIESATADSPRMIQAASCVCVPDTIDSYQADIEDSDGTVPNVNVSNLYADMLRALTDSNNPDEKYRHWVKWKSGVGYTDIAKSENPEWESEYGREEAQRLWTSEADKIRKQVERFDKQLAKRPSTQNERKTS